MNNTDDKKNDDKGGESGKPLTKEDIIKILRDEARAFKKPIINALNRSGLHPGFHLVKGLGFTLLLAAGLVGYYIQWNADIKQRQTEATARAAEQLQKTIDRKIEWEIKLNDAMVSLKEARALIILDCQNGHTISPHAQQKMRLEERYKVIKAFTGSDHIFDGDVMNKYREYIDFDESVKDLCAKDIPSEIAWRQYLIDIDNLTGKSIKKDVEQLTRLNSLKAT